MGKGTGFGKTILIGDQFVLEEVPAIVSAISYETVTTVERNSGDGWALEDNRTEVPGYKDKKKEQQARSIDRILEVMNLDAKQNPIKIVLPKPVPLPIRVSFDDFFHFFNELFFFADGYRDGSRQAMAGVGEASELGGRFGKQDVEPHDSAGSNRALHRGGNSHGDLHLIKADRTKARDLVRDDLKASDVLARVN